MEKKEKIIYNINDKYSFWKGHPLDRWRSHQLNPVKGFKEGCHMIINGIKKLVKTIEFTGVTINIGIIGLNFTGGFSKENINYRM